MGLMAAMSGWGSSPRVRGAPEDALHEISGIGIIPACAGSTSCGGMTPACGGDHPRVCGEHHGLPLRSGSGLGSSPRVRGAQHIKIDLVAEGGIIPACAGSTR